MTPDQPNRHGRSDEATRLITVLAMLCGAAGSSSAIAEENRSVLQSSRPGGAGPLQPAGGRWEAIASCSRLTADDTNDHSDIYLRDPASGRTQLLSRSAFGDSANGPSIDPAISADGRWVVFTSEASNLIDRDTNGHSDVFVVERATNRIRKASQGHNGVQGNGPSMRGCMSQDGRYVAFQSMASNLAGRDANRMWDVYLHDMMLDRITRVSIGLGLKESNGDSHLSGLSDDGRFVLYQSTATNLVRGDLNAANDVFVHDRRTALARRASVDADGGELSAPSHALSISADGRYVAFTSVSTPNAGNRSTPQAGERTRDLRMCMTTPRHTTDVASDQRIATSSARPTAVASVLPKMRAGKNRAGW